MRTRSNYLHIKRHSSISPSALGVGSRPELPSLAPPDTQQLRDAVFKELGRNR